MSTAFFATPGAAEGIAGPLVCGATGTTTSFENAGNEKSKRLSLSSGPNEIFAVICAGSDSGSMRASRNAPFRASTSGADDNSLFVLVAGSKISLITTRARTFRACATGSGRV